jgi:hypothetical protein
VIFTVHSELCQDESRKIQTCINVVSALGALPSRDLKKVVVSCIDGASDGIISGDDGKGLNYDLPILIIIDRA